ncbi:putative UDP-rhamnose:rhamnosyltransferase 1 [Curcuma longa]|uniref:putative UDP-rhamnose:rhamnosyltransferase 1 n=1 Tax=Curcuma longa TaxID=136217 RepID=UPI003D9E8815
MADHGDGASLHIAVFPWLAFGHMLPFLRLSKSLAKRRHRVSFLSTPRNIARLPKLPPDAAPLIDFVPLPLPPVEHLPPDAESTNDLLPDQIQYLKKALDGLQSPFECFLRSTKPDWVILDFCQHWAPAIAAELNVPCAFFSVIRASSLFFFLEKIHRTTSSSPPEELTKPPESVPFPTTMALRLHEAKGMIWAYRDNASGISDVQRIASVVKSSNLVAFRSCFEHESPWLSLFEARFCAGDVVPVGLLPTPADELASQAEAESSSTTTILRWLSEQLPRSVVYVAIGSEATLSAEQERDLASGLELSAAPFLWAVRKPSGSGTSGGGGARRHCHGLVIEGWVPQLEILRHNSVGAFLTHCGYSSVIESLQFGLPLVMLPSIIDTGLIARWCSEMKVGEEVARNEADGSFTGEDVAIAIRKVMVEEEAKEFRRNAEKQQEVVADTKLHESYVDNFIQRLRSKG